MKVVYLSYVGTTTPDALFSRGRATSGSNTGSRASFRRRVLDALRSIVQAPAAFCCLGTDDARAYVDSSRSVDSVVQIHQKIADHYAAGQSVLAFVTADVCTSPRDAPTSRQNSTR